MSFETDLREQRGNEALLALALAKRHESLIYPNGKGKDSDKDFILYERTPVEVKWDKMAEETGNLYFEIFNTKLNQPSGVITTKATRWYHFVPPNRLFQNEPKYILGLIERCKLAGIGRTVEGGDNNSRGYIVPIKTALEWGYFEVTEFIP